MKSFLFRYTNTHTCRW